MFRSGTAVWASVAKGADGNTYILKASWVIPPLVGHQGNMLRALEGIDSMLCFVGKVLYNSHSTAVETRKVFRMGGHADGEHLVRQTNKRGRALVRSRQDLQPGDSQPSANLPNETCIIEICISQTSW